MPSHRREYGAGTALQLHTLLPLAVATKTSPSCSRLARRSAAAAASVAVAPPPPAPPLPPHQRTTMALLYPQQQQQQISNCHDIISASMESACFQVSQYATHHSSLQQGTHDQSLLQQQDRHHEQTQQSSARGGSGIGAYAAADRNCRLSSAASGAGLDLLQHVEPQQQRLASSSSESSRSRNLSGVVMAGASTTTEQMDMDMDALDMSLQLQLGDFQEWWPPIAASEEVVSSNNNNNNNHHQHALPLISNNNSNIIPQQPHQREREEREKTQNNNGSAVFVAAAAEAINKEQQQEETSFDLESWCAARSSIAGVQNLLNIDDNNNDNSNALPKATCNNKRSHVLSSSSRDQSCGGHNIAAAGATMVEPMTPTIERGGSRGVSHQQHKGAGGRISSPCAAVTYPREGDKAANLTPPVVVAAAAVHRKKPRGSSSSGCVKRAVSQRESHIWSERQRRKGMNHLFSTLRSLLPQPSSKTDKSTVVSEIIKYIQSLQLQLDILAKKRQQMLEARALSQTVVPTVSLHHPMEPPKTSPAAAAAAVTPENLAISLLDHQGNAHHGNHESSMLYVQPQQQQQADLAAMSANLNHPLQQQEIIQQTDSCLQSFLGANVGLHICGSNAFITISSPRGQRGIFHRILVTVQNQHLDVINAFISTSKASIFHCLHCQALQGSDLSKEELHTALQMVITNYGQSI
ncbi:unnamed protein product [Sphagnum troendelagicum]|uniref:BHLH domain-containing protein n=1 Tax=Sphagnum troendelagicum TaxID=128251 RepID=A0ABP0UD66_9BRYO